MRAVVTGASRGVGRAIALAYAREGAALVVTGRSARGLEGVIRACREAGASCAPVVLDLADPASVDHAADAAVAALGRVDVVVNNAGVLGSRRPLAEADPDEVGHVVAVNLAGTLRLTQRLLPHLADGGAVISVTSGAAGRARWAGYAVSKLGLEGMTAMLREELADRGIRAVAVNPGPARTDMRAAAHPGEDPATVPHPSALVEPFLAIAEGADPGPRVEAAEWGRG
jgi:NAD(P)-dependent dehydrogenase (short-subunit alcohol dehydrogenase family)